MPNIAEHLNDLVEIGGGDSQFRLMCCRHWQEFRDGVGIADDLADYAREAFPKGTSPEQDAAIRSFPTEPLRLLRHVVIQGLDYPPDPPDETPPITLTFKAVEARDERASISVEISASNDATVTFRVASVV